MIMMVTQRAGSLYSIIRIQINHSELLLFPPHTSLQLEVGSAVALTVFKLAPGSE